MTGGETLTLKVASQMDVIAMRQAVRARALSLKFSTLDQTKLMTAASELGRNLLIYGGGGEVRIENVQSGTQRGLRLVFEDHGPGIRDIKQSLTDGFTGGSGMGLGLGGARRLMSEFDIVSSPGNGTRVTVTKWI